MANANAAPSCTVKTDVCVRKPGPIEDVAMRNTAPTSGPILRGAAGWAAAFDEDGSEVVISVTPLSKQR